MEQNAKACHSDDSPEFFKIYTNALSSKAKIPPEFFQNLNGYVPLAFTLEGTWGRSWRVQVGNVGQDFYFLDGWRKFVQDNSLTHGDFLTFCYGGCSRLRVEIFGTHGCRKDVVLTNSNENAVEQHHGKPKKTKPTDEDTSFRVLLKKTYVHHYLKFPSGFRNIKKHWRNRKGATLLSRGREWKVSIAKSGKHFQLFEGWPSFVKESYLKKGDVCDFEVIDDNDDGIVLRVSTVK